MGLTTKIQGSVQAAFNGALADAVSTISLQQITQVFNKLANTTTDTIATIATRGVVGEFVAKEIDNESILPSDVKIIILQNELAAVPFVDNWVLHGSERYKVVKVTKDPADCIWTLQCRK